MRGHYVQSYKTQLENKCEGNFLEADMKSQLQEEDSNK
jgi:hypothetical protein